MKQVKDINEIYGTQGKLLLDFSAPYCVPCKGLRPHLLEAEERNTDVKFMEVDVVDSMSIARAFRVMSVPTILLLEDGQVVNRKTSPAHDSLDTFIRME